MRAGELSNTGCRWDVFLCHSSADDSRVERLANALEARGLRVWFGKTAIQGSSSIPLKIEEGIEASRTVVFCLSPAFLGSEWTAYERASALHGDPANLRHSFLLLEFKECQLPSGLAHFKRLDFKRYSDRKVDQIIAALNLGKLAAKLPAGPVDALLDDAVAHERTGNYAKALDASRQALAIALEASEDLPDTARHVATARSEFSHHLLLMEGNGEEAWKQADLAADPTVLDGYPELLFRALVNKAEAAILTSRLQIAKGAVLAAQELQDDEHDER